MVNASCALETSALHTHTHDGLHILKVSISHASPLFSSRYRFRLCLREWVAVRRVAPGSCREMQEPNALFMTSDQNGRSFRQRWTKQNRCSLLLEAERFLSI